MIVANARIGFSTSTAWYSDIIRRATRAKVSHTFLLLTLWGREVVLEEGVFGWSMRTRENFERSGNRIVEVVKPEVPIDVAVRQSLDWLGQRYDYAGLVGMAWVMFCRWLHKKVRNPLASHHAMFCSEANTRILQIAQYPGAERLNPSTTTPEDLLTFLSP